MRLLFAHPAALTAGNHEGAIKAYRGLIAALADAGNECEVVAVPAPSAAMPRSDEWDQLSSVQPRGAGAGVAFSLTRALPLAEVRTGTGDMLTRALRVARIELTFGALLRRRIVDFDPDWIISENGAMNLRLLVALAGKRLALGVTTTASLPFGPRRTTRAWRGAPGAYGHVAKFFCASSYVAEYLREHVRVEALVHPPVAYGRRPFLECAQFTGTVTMVNPAPHKGGGIFAALARRFADRSFRAITSYSQVVPELRALPNVRIVASTDDLDAALFGTSVLLVPSMWGEAWGMICIDAMLRGIPVLASDDGGLPEATLGVSTCIPTRPGRLRRRWNGDLEFTAPGLDTTPWSDALAALLTDRARWQEQSARSKAAAAAFIDRLSVDRLTGYLAG